MAIVRRTTRREFLAAGAGGVAGAALLGRRARGAVRPIGDPPAPARRVAAHARPHGPELPVVSVGSRVRARDS